MKHVALPSLTMHSPHGFPIGARVEDPQRFRSQVHLLPVSVYVPKVVYYLQRLVQLLGALHRS